MRSEQIQGQPPEMRPGKTLHRWANPHSAGTMPHSEQVKSGEPLMKRYVVIVITLGLLGTLAAVPARTQEPKKPEALMKKKLEHSQKVLDGIATQDFKKIETHAEELLEISKQAEFQTLKTKDYDRHSLDFRRSAEGLIEAAKKKNIDAAALAYVEMTLTCVKCHKHVRESRMTGLD